MLWTVRYKNFRDDTISEVTMESASEPNLAAMQAQDKAAAYVLSAVKTTRTLYQIRYTGRGNPSDVRYNVLAFSPGEAVAHVGNHDNVSVVNIATDVYIAGIDEPMKNVFPAPMVLTDASQDPGFGPRVMPKVGKGQADTAPSYTTAAK